jgi:hypothetical protein
MEMNFQPCQPLGLRDGSLVRFIWRVIFRPSSRISVKCSGDIFFPCLAPICDHASWGCSGSHGKFMVLRYEPNHNMRQSHIVSTSSPSSIMSGNP